MPRLNPIGTAVLMGPGAGPMRCWLDDARTIEQVCDASGCRLVATVMATGEQTVMAHLGANWLQAGGGVWAARLQGYGYFDSLGRQQSDLMPLSVDPVSGAVLVSNYTTGAGLWIWWADDRLERISAGVLDTQQGDCDNLTAVYRMGGRVQRWPEQDSRESMADPRYAGGYLCANASKGLAWFPWEDMSRGLLLSNDGHDFNPDICLVSDRLVRVVSSRTAGEVPGDLRTYDIDPVTLTVNGKPGVPYSQPEPPIPPDPPVPPIPPIPPLPPVRKDVLMSAAFTLRKSLLKKGSWNPEAWIYPDITHPENNLSVVDVTGEFRPGGLPNNGPSESFYVSGDRAVVIFDSHEWTFLVDTAR